MSSQYSVIDMCDGTNAVVLPVHGNSRRLEIVGSFYDRSRALSYAEQQNKRLSEEREEPDQAPERDLPEGQRSVLYALVSNRDDQGLVAMSSRAISDASSVPVGSIAGIVDELAKKQLVEKLDQKQGNTNVYRV